MVAKADTGTQTLERELVITRLIDAPRELVFKAWTEPEHLLAWWGPKHHPAVSARTDPRPGGTWRAALRSVEDGRVLTHGGNFREVVPPDRLVFTFTWDEEGERGLETVVTMTFADQGGKTLMTLRQTPFQSTGEREGHRGGWTSTFERLDEISAFDGEEWIMTVKPQARLSNERTVTITRVFDAPRELVFRMWTEPKHMAEWWGPQCFTNPVCELDARPGGKILIHMRGPDGTVYPMTGIFREVIEPKLLVFTGFAEDTQGNRLLESLTTVTFVAQGKKTKLTVNATAKGLAPIAPQMLAGMEAGWTQSLEKLAELVARG